MTSEEYDKLQIPCFHSAILNLTNECNCRCKYCFMDFKKQEMTQEIAKKAIDWTYRVWLRRVGLLNEGFSQAGLPQISFFGGEPMLKWNEIIIPSLEYIDNVINPKIKKLYPEGYMGTGITTNGTLLTPDRIRLLNLYHCQPLLSIDGNKETQDYNRPLKAGGSSFDKISPNIPYLLRYFPNTTFRSTVIPDTVESLYDNFLFAVQSGFRNFFVTPNKYENWTDEKIEILREQMIKIGLAIFYFLYEEDVFIHYSLLESFFIQVFNTNRIKMSINKCGLGTASISIGADGTLFGCQEEASKENSIYRIGHIDTGIDKELHLKLLNEISQHNYLQAENRNCDDCACVNFCAKNYCTVSNFTTTNHANICPEIECIWKNILYETALTVLAQAEKENSDVFKNYLLKLIENGG